MEEALNLGYADQEREQPVDMRVLYKIFNSKKVIKSGLNVSGGFEPGVSATDQKIVTNPQLAVKLLNKNKAYKESGDVAEKVESLSSSSGDSDRSSSGEEVDQDLKNQKGMLKQIIQKNKERTHLKSSQSDLTQFKKKN